MPQLDTGDSPWPMFELTKGNYPYRFVVLGQDSKYVYVGRMLNHRDEVIQPLKVRKLAPHIKLLIGLAGTIGSGKSVASELLAKLGAHVKSSHSSVAGLLRYLDIDQSESREALQSAGSFFGVAYPTTWVNRMIRYFNSQEAEVGVWDGVRFPHDIILSRIAAGDYTLDPVSGTYVLKATRFHPVLIDADEKTRESRLGSRKRPSDPTKPSRFWIQEIREHRIFAFRDTRNLAEELGSKVMNDGTPEDLAGKINALWRELKSTHGIQ